MTRVAFVLACLFIGSGARALSLDEYLAQVTGQNLDKKQYQERTGAETLARHEARLSFRPTFFAQAQFGRDQAKMIPPLLQFKQIETTQYSLGFNQQFSFGLQSKLTYQVSRTNYVDSNMGEAANLDFWDAKPILEFSMPLWANAFGRGVRAERDLIAAQADAQRASAHEMNTQVQVAAEAAYWQMAAAKETLEIQQKALKSAKDVEDYLTKKLRMNLTERSDVVQASALVESRELQLQRARNEAFAAAQTFNANRQIESSAIPDQIEPIHNDTIVNETLPQARTGARVDLLTAAAQTRVARFNALATAERNRPKLEMYGTFGLFGRDSHIQKTFEDLTASKRDTVAVGVRFNMPLDLAAQADVRQAAMARARAAQTALDSAEFKQDKDWSELIRKMGESQALLKIATRVESIQGEKLALEKERLRQGRTTTYQVLLFEQDLLDSSLNRLRTAAEYLNLRSKLKSYEIVAAGVTP